jgi:FHS family glucose/mannose:H+ symporter-like MFS transporter
VLRLALGFAFLLALYVSLENGVGAWETTYLRDASGYPQSSAARATSLFWVAITVGRLLGGWLARTMTMALLVTGSLVGAAAGLVVAGLPGLGLIGFTLTGVFLAPIFPAAFAWLSSTRLPPLTMTLVFASSVLGPTLSAPVIGAATGSSGAGAIPLVLVIIALLAIVALVAVRHGLDPA